ncbi:MAG TPA: 23S rRNA (adenine(2503)-C(2))-methyltransferase RlmN [Bacillota bacterium]|nr:23S rRNA (adenine(2503)-C(2))-methyltransferase RlmN [Bacillota bacterium]
MDIKDLLFEELQQFLEGSNFPGYRAGQIFDWVYQKKALQWEEMTNLPQNMRQALQDKEVVVGSLKLLSSVSSPDGTVKYLFELPDQQTIESVFLPDAERNTVCFSTQVGCGMGCAFCATGKNGLTRNLTPGEIIDQIVRISAITNSRVTNVVAMGQGEPLANYEALLKAIRILNHPKGLALGARRITISTCGIVPGIVRLADEPFQVNLAISLHAADDALRDRLMPVNKVYPLSKLLHASKCYIEKTGRRITYEYTLIHEVNDSPQDAVNLIKYLSGMLCHVNLIPFNPVAETGFKRSKPERIKEFAAQLSHAGIETTIRKERGVALAAACGQLQSKRLERP